MYYTISEALIRLVCASVVRTRHKTGFLMTRLIYHSDEFDSCVFSDDTLIELGCHYASRTFIYIYIYIKNEIGTQV